MQISSEMIAFGAMIIALAGLLFNRRKDSSQSAADFAKLGAQLGQIQSGVDDLRIEIRTMRGQISGLSERLGIVETKIKNLEKEVFKESKIDEFRRSH